MCSKHRHSLYEVPEKITNLSLANEWISKDPFMGIKFHEKEVHREFLTWDELQTVIKQKI